MDNRCAQEILDGLPDHTTAFEEVLVRLGGGRPHATCWGHPAGEATRVAKAVNTASHEAGVSLNEHVVSDELTPALKHMETERSDRESLAVAKVKGCGTVGEDEMSVSRMEHLRKAVPVYIKFLKAYLTVVERAETEHARHVSTTEEKGTQMAREALSSLGTSKGGADAHAFVKSIQAGHVRDNQFKVITHRDGKIRATKELERVEELIGLLDASKTNANAAISEPFGKLEPLEHAAPDVDGGRKSVQEILCASTSGPASLYAKLDKISKGMVTSADTGQPGSYVIAGVDGPGLRRVELCRYDILQRYRDWFELLIRYKTAMDRLNLQVKFVGGDGKEITMQDELVRHDQSSRLGRLLDKCLTQINEARSSVTNVNADIEKRELTKQDDLDRRHKRETRQASDDRKTHRVHHEGSAVSRGRGGEREMASTPSEDEATVAARRALEAAEDQARIARQQSEMTILNDQLGKYRKDNWQTLVIVDGIEDRLKEIKTAHDSNQKVNRRRRAPANAQTWVACRDI